MLKKTRFDASRLFSLIALALIPVTSHALQVTEVMYDPAGVDSGREWVEVLNDGPETVDLTSWKLFENGVAHAISVASGGFSLPPGERVIVADKADIFSSEYPNVAHVLDSAFSLSNSGETISLLSPEGLEVSPAAWDSSSGATDGKSWQLAGDGAWVAATPTPGSENADREESPPVSAPIVSVSAHAATPGLSSVKPPSRFAIDVGRDRLVPAGAELRVDPLLSGAERASFSWSWGDGSFSRGRRGEHTYHYPGSYVLVLNGRAGGGGVAVSRTTVWVVDPKVAVRFEPGGRGFVEISNVGATELNLGGFFLEMSGCADFAFPADTILLPGTATRIPNDVSGFSGAAASEPRLFRPDGELVASS